MADNPNPTLEDTAAAPAKKKGVKRRAFLIGGVAVVGAGLFGIKLADSNAAKKAVELTTGKGEHNFATWLKIAEDDSITIYSPQPNFVPVRPTSSRKTHSSGVSGSASTVTALPFTFKLIDTSRS